MASMEAKLGLYERHYHQAGYTADAAKVKLAAKGYCSIHPDIRLRRKTGLPFFRGKEEVIHATCPKCDREHSLDLERRELENAILRQNLGHFSHHSPSSPSQQQEPISLASPPPHLRFPSRPSLLDMDDFQNGRSSPQLSSEAGSNSGRPRPILTRFSQSTPSLNVASHRQQQRADICSSFDGDEDGGGLEDRRRMMTGRSISCRAALDLACIAEDIKEEEQGEEEISIPKPDALLRRTSSFADAPSFIYESISCDKSISSLGDYSYLDPLSMLVLPDDFDVEEEKKGELIVGQEQEQQQQHQQHQQSEQQPQQFDPLLKPPAVPLPPKKVPVNPASQELHQNSMPSLHWSCYNHKQSKDSKTPDKKPGAEHCYDVEDLQAFKEYGIDPEPQVELLSTSQEDAPPATPTKASDEEETKTPIQNTISLLREVSSADQANTICVDLQTLMETLEQRQEAVQEGGIDVLLQVMKRYPEHSDLQEEACWTLGSIASDCDDNKAAIAEAGAVEVIVQTMSFHLQEEGVQEAALGALHDLACDHLLNNAAVMEAHGIEAVVQAMDQHKTNLEVELSGCSLLGNLASNCSDAQNQVAEVGGIATIFRACMAHKEEAGLQECAIGALGNLACDNDTTKCVISQSGGFGFIRTAMQDHEEESGVQEQCFYAIQNLIFQSDDNKDSLIVKYRCHLVMLASLRRHIQDPHVLEAGLDALLILTRNHAPSKDALAKCGGIKVMNLIIDNHELDVRLHESACRVLINLAHEHPKNKAQIGEVGAIASILCMMKVHLEDNNVQQIGLKTLTTLCVNDRNKGLLGNADGVEAVVTCMLKHRCPGVQEAGCRLLMNLAFCDKLRLSIAEAGGILAILYAMQQHENNAALQERALAALRELAMNDTVQFGIQAAGGVDTIVNCAKNHEGHRGIEGQARGALSNLHCEDGMLESLLSPAFGNSYSSRTRSMSTGSSSDGSFCIE